MGQVFTYTLAGDPARKLAEIKAAAAAKRMTFSGDLRGGHFSGMGLAGTYSIGGSTITVSVVTKPFIVSWEYVDSELRRFIEG